LELTNRSTLLVQVVGIAVRKKNMNERRDQYTATTALQLFAKFEIRVTGTIFCNVYQNFRQKCQ